MVKIVKRFTLRKKLNLAVALVCLAAAVILLFVPDIAGVADDGTCTAVLAAAGLSCPGGGTGPGYLDVRYTWKTAEYTGVRNVQALLLCLAKYLCYWCTGSRYFDLRYLAGIYLVMYLPAVFIITRSALSRTERRGSMVTVAVFAALIFSDAGYITYFNSLYPEALIFILLLYAEMSGKNGVTYLWQDLGLAGLLAVMLACGVTMYCAQGQERIEFLIMLIVLFVPLLFCALKVRGLAYTLAGVQILAYTIYKLYMYSAYGNSLTVEAYAWAVIPAAAVLSMSLFVSASVRLEMVNEFLSSQVEEYVMVDESTGLYNRRSLFNDLGKNMAYAARNGLDITLMVVRLKYADELKRILSSGQFRELKRVAAEKVQDALRVEDRVYGIDEDGTIAMILTCDKSGAGIVERRIRGAFQEKNAFNGIMGKEMRVDLKIGYLQYDGEVHTNAVAFFNQTENELQYDV